MVSEAMMFTKPDFYEDEPCHLVEYQSIGPLPGLSPEASHKSKNHQYIVPTWDTTFDRLLIAESTLESCVQSALCVHS